ncbi:unnamed protein product, partial [Mesorhabditis belari]|uniref:Peptidase A1 domain-containing protein n=1 Tax=Mesorhabditis belari TaxID=2138241 RepID=A0AAF3F3X8_9BILA
MKLLIIILLSFLAIEALVLPLKGPRREDVKRFLKKRFEDNDAEPKPTADFLIGSNGQRVELSLDFTTRDTWVVDANCGNELCYMGTIGFDATQSTTFSNSSLPFKGFFYDELDAYHPVSGFAVMDKIQLSTYPQNDDKWISVFALVNKRDSNTTMGNWPYYGVVGLAPSPGDMLDPVLPHLLQNYDQKVLTIWMHNDGGFQFFEGFYPGSYEFDWLDNCDNTTYFTVPTTETNTWRFVINGVMIGNYSRAKDENAEINAQTMLTGVPTIVYNSIVALTGAKPGNSDLLNIDCRKEYPDLTLNLGSKNLTVPSEVYISTDMENGARVCRLLLYPTNATGFNPAWKLSYLWFYEMCFHFNLTPPSVGFSQQTW